jgi:hypothetical protein
MMQCTQHWQWRFTAIGNSRKDMFNMLSEIFHNRSHFSEVVLSTASVNFFQVAGLPGGVTSRQ